MKKNIIISLKLTAIMILICSVLYPLAIAAVGTLSPGGGNGRKIISNGRVVGYSNIGQKFTDEKYFWGRPSAVEYNAAGSGGSNKGPSNPDYLRIVQSRIDTLIAHHPGLRKEQVPADLVTASGSGLDPHISPEAAYIQVPRIARIRKIPDSMVAALVDKKVEHHFPGPSVINVLSLNIALDELKNK